MRPRVLVTGASGFIGRAVAQALTVGFEVHAISRSAIDSPIEGIDWSVCDLMESSARRSLIDRVQPSHLVNLAWTTDPGRYWSSDDNIDWMCVSLSLLREFAIAGGKRAVMSGTCAEYDWNEPGPFAETSRTAGDTVYAAAKLSTMQVADAFAANNAVSFGWARLFYVYGPREAEERLIPSLILAALRGAAPTLRHPQNVIDLMHVADVGTAIAALLESDVEGPVNVCSGEPLLVSDLASRVAGELKAPEAPYGLDVPPVRVVGDPTRLRREVGFTPQTSLSDGLRSSIDWWATEKKRRRL